MNKVDTYYEDRTITYFNDMLMYKHFYDYVKKIVANDGRQRIFDYLETHHYVKVVIYGSGLMGRLLLDILKEHEKIQLVGVYDKNGNKGFGIDSFLSLGDIMAEEVDCILITPLSCEREITQELLDLGIKKSKFLLEILDNEKMETIYENGISV